MKTFKIVLAGAAALGFVLGGTQASAESVRASGSLPGVVSVKHNKQARTVAPATRGSKESDGGVDTTDVVLTIGAAAAGGLGLYEITKPSGGTPTPVSP